MKLTPEKKAEIEKEYDAFYEAKPNKWDSIERNSLAALYIEKFLKSPPASLLDVGCGIGHTIKYLKVLWPNTLFGGVDPSPKGIEICKMKMSGKGFEFHTGYLGEDLPFKARFEVVMLLGVLEHIEDTVAAMHAIKQLVLKKGIVYIEVPNCLDYETSDGIEGYKRIRVGNKQVEWHRSRENWESIFKECGFKIKGAYVGPRKEYEFLWILKV